MELEQELNPEEGSQVRVVLAVGFLTSFVSTIYSRSIAIMSKKYWSKIVIVMKSTFEIKILLGWLHGVWDRHFSLNVILRSKESCGFVGLRSYG